jgi:hypothetical protein
MIVLSIIFFHFMCCFVTFIFLIYIENLQQCAEHSTSLVDVRSDGYILSDIWLDGKMFCFFVWVYRGLKRSLWLVNIRL